MATPAHILTRNEVIEQAYRKIHTLRPGGSLSLDQIEQAVTSLNLIIREEDLHGTDQQKNLWALQEAHLILTANQIAYNAGVTYGLAKDVLDLVSVFYRDSSGDESEIKIITVEQYEAITEKDDTGDLEKVYLKRNTDLSKQSLFVWPALDSAATTSEVLGTDTLNYKCILAHTSATLTQPVTGVDWELYWELGGTAGAAWATATDYTNGELLRYVYKRPLYAFTLPTDNPDMPPGWGRYLMYRLAADLAPEYGIQLDERGWLRQSWMEARAEIFPSTRSGSTDIYNKGLFYSILFLVAGVLNTHMV